ncbi:hypothetical protein L1987_71259 [Smallanthus sonchifolius]|uniref:Uncharacterized protein n=1 Tax=Smallanthus sonchifolius TaxID=185202 RepID=A0ACB9ASK8_9ASTR|nr:hypothetical protein L1987_71259 [Smallanthus sonchifolius]
MAACQHCMAEGTHADHRVISIYRLVYKDVVSLQQMSVHIDCSGIQPYASNGRQVLALHPLPHYNSGQLNQDRACRTCTRILMNPDTYSYCSIACKLSINPAAENQGEDGAGSGSGAGSKDGGGTGTRSKKSDSGANCGDGRDLLSGLFS